METIEGFVDHIIFQNPDNGYTVLELSLVHMLEPTRLGKMS